MMAAEDFVRTEDLVSKTNLDFQRRFYKCEDWSDEDLDEFADLLRNYPGGEWMDRFGPEVKRTYAMSCIRLKEDAPAAFRRQIVEGIAWLSFGSNQPKIYRKEDEAGEGAAS